MLSGYLLQGHSEPKGRSNVESQRGLPAAEGRVKRQRRRRTGEMFRSVPIRPQAKPLLYILQTTCQGQRVRASLSLLMDIEGPPAFSRKDQPLELGLKSKGKNSYILDIVLNRISCLSKAGHPQITSGQFAWGLKPASVHADGPGVDHEAILTWPISIHLWLPLNQPQGMPTVWKIETPRLRLKTL